MTDRTPLVLGTHHVAVICSDYERSKRFYDGVLGLEVLAEVYREARRSHKLDLKLPDGTQIELFSFPDPPPRPSYPEACGLRHLAFTVADLDAAVRHLERHGIAVEPMRLDEYTGQDSPSSPTPTGCRSNCTSEAGEAVHISRANRPGRSPHRHAPARELAFRRAVGDHEIGPASKLVDQIAPSRRIETVRRGCRGAT